MHFTEIELLQMLEAWLWPFFRVGGLVIAAPIMGTRSLPARGRLIMILAITAVLVPALPPSEYIEPFSATGVLVSIQQVLIGLTMGLVVKFMFIVFEIGGQVIAQQMGLGFAAMVDPQNGNQVPVIAQFYIILATLGFLAINGHLLLIQVLANSFKTLPVGIEGITRTGLMDMVNWGSWLISNSILIALPAIAAMLIVNLSFGVMTRAAPQLNIFAVGFPIMILMGMAIIFLTLQTLEPHIERLSNEALLMASTMVEAR